MKLKDNKNKHCIHQAIYFSTHNTIWNSFRHSICDSIMFNFYSKSLLELFSIIRPIELSLRNTINETK